MKRKRLLAILVITLLSVLLCGCGDKGAEQKEYIGIISAMDNEIDILLKEATIERVDTVVGVEYHIGTLSDMYPLYRTTGKEGIFSFSRRPVHYSYPEFL